MRAAADGEAWWARPLAIAALLLLSTLPLWFADVAPLIDYPAHIGRYKVELDLGQSALLQKNWIFHWSLIGNLGVDLLIVPLAAILGLEKAAWLIAAVLPGLMIWGMFRLSRAVHGRVPATTVAAMPFAFAAPYQFGFVNYWLGLALCLHAAASWIALERRPGLRSALFLPMGAALWVVHAYAWAVGAVILGCWEAARAWDDGRRGLGWAFRAGLRAAPFLFPLILMVAWRQGGGATETVGWFEWPHKFGEFAATLRDQSQALDILSLCAAAAVLAYAAFDPRLKLNPPLALAGFAFSALALLLPYRLLGSAYADSRLFPVIFIVFLLAIGPAQGGRPARAERAIAAAAALLFAVRIAVSAAGFNAYDRTFDSHLRALDFVERGASIATLVRVPCPMPWRRPRLEHLDSLAIVRREAFVNSQWDVAGAELMRPKGAVGTAFNSDPSSFVSVGEPPCPGNAGEALRERISAIPRDRFAYVWIVDFETAALPAYPGLERLYSDERSSLYRITR
jgi:hypothetical protein